MDIFERMRAGELIRNTDPGFEIAEQSSGQWIYNRYPSNLHDRLWFGIFGVIPNGKFKHMYDKTALYSIRRDGHYLRGITGNYTMAKCR
ncbi:MAG: hypothetical protein LUE26_12315 [Alistipes sp.]|nr:hypothetical protein [Alistipes sp.]